MTASCRGLYVKRQVLSCRTEPRSSAFLTHTSCLGHRDTPCLTPSFLCPTPLRFGDHFEWNKVTCCIHNILSGQRWIEHYGEVLIRNTQDSSCHCKITFCKVQSSRLRPPPQGRAGQGNPPPEPLPGPPRLSPPPQGRAAEPPKPPPHLPTPGQVLELQCARGAGHRVQPQRPRPPPPLWQMARGALPGSPAWWPVHLETQ